MRGKVWHGMGETKDSVMREARVTAVIETAPGGNVGGGKTIFRQIHLSANKSFCGESNQRDLLPSYLHEKEIGRVVILRLGPRHHVSLARHAEPVLKRHQRLVNKKK